MSDMCRTLYYITSRVSGVYKYINLYYTFPRWKGVIDIFILQEIILRVDNPYRFPQAWRIQFTIEIV